MSLKEKEKGKDIPEDINEDTPEISAKGLPFLLSHEASNLKAYYSLLEKCDEEGTGHDLLKKFCGITLSNIEDITALIKGDEKGKDKA